jgi:hypothetical protein
MLCPWYGSGPALPLGSRLRPPVEEGPIWVITVNCIYIKKLLKIKNKKK